MTTHTQKVAHTPGCLIAAAPELLKFLINARAIAMTGDMKEAYAELRGDFCKKLLTKAQGTP